MGICFPADVDGGLVASKMNKVFVSESDHLPRLNTNHKVFKINEELPDQYVINVFTTLKALESVKVKRLVGLTTSLHGC